MAEISNGQASFDLVQPNIILKVGPQQVVSLTELVATFGNLVT